MSRTRLIACLAVLLLLAPLYTRAEEKAPPLAWFAVRSYQRLEQRVREFLNMTKTPGLSDMVLGMLQLQLAGMQGLDRQRPLAVVWPALGADGKPQMAVLLPYTQKEDMLGSLGKFFPQTTTQSDLLHFQGGPQAAFGRVDEAATMLIMAESQEIVQGLDAALPADLLGADDSGPDMVLRMDVDTTRKRHKAAWDTLIQGVEKGWRDAQEKAAEDTDTPAQKEFSSAYLAWTERQWRQSMEDLSQVEARLTLAPDGWVFEFGTQMRPGSTTATLLKQQTGHTSTATPLLSAAAPLRFAYTVEMADEWRQEVTNLVHLGRKAVEETFAAKTDVTPEQRTAGMAGIVKGFQVLEKWLTHPQFEIAAELQGSSAADFALTAWLPIADSGKNLTELLDALEPLLAASKDATILTRNAAQHGDTPLHRLAKPADASEPSVFLAAAKDILAVHVGASSGPLTQLLDRIHTQAAPAQTDASLHLALSVAQLLQIAQNSPMATSEKSAQGLATAAQMLQGATEPLRLDVLSQDNTATLRLVIPGAIVESGAEALGQQIIQGLGKAMGGK